MVARTRIPRTVLTYEHYLELPNDGRRYEIIEGELFVSPAPTFKHQHVSMSLSAQLFNHVRSHRLGRVVTAPTDVLLANTSIVQPDILYVSRQQRAIITDANIQGAPDLVVEIISPSSTKTDKETKRDLYAKYGVRHYWVADPMEEWVRAYERGDDGVYELVAEGLGNVNFAAPPFPDLVIPLADLWDALEH